MAFTIHGLSGHETMPMNRLFEKRPVNKTEQIEAYHKINSNQPRDLADASKDHYQHASLASNSYKEIEASSDDIPVVLASDVMSSPVVVLAQSASIADVLKVFQEKRFRHLPVLSPANNLVGMVSDRDVLRYMSGISSKDDFKKVAHETDDKVVELISSSVISTSVDADVRYVARIFVEKRIGAMPVLKGNKLMGIITRSDILQAVMQYFHLRLWV